MLTYFNPLRLAITAVLFVLFCGSATAQVTYDLTAFPFIYNDVSLATANLTTNSIGTFNNPKNIEDIFNNSTYEATLFGPSNTITHIDNSNSKWELQFSLFSDPSATLTIDPLKISLTFSTPSENSGGALLLRSTNNLSVLQYRQENNVSNYNFAGFEFNAVYDAYSPLLYGTTFVMPAIPASVPVPAAIWLMGFGLFCLFGMLKPPSPRRLE
ncbi:MAG: hypothetical protein PHR94_16805 [Methylomonas lenta]|nr:hypothetical protein [Methylomonas lenta]